MHRHTCGGQIPATEEINIPLSHRFVKVAFDTLTGTPTICTRAYFAKLVERGSVKTEGCDLWRRRPGRQGRQHLCAAWTQRCGENDAHAHFDDPVQTDVW